jgi:hypothetical protein
MMIRLAQRQRLFLCGFGIVLSVLITYFTHSGSGHTQTHLLIAQTNEVQIFVAPNGQDRNPGTLAAPVASLSRARDLARQAMARKRQNVTVYLRGGLYRLAQPLELTSQDAGADGYKVTYAAYAKEQPILSGGVPISGWRQTSSGLYTTKTNLRFRQLYINDRPGVRARFPNGNSYLRLRQWYLDDKPDIQSTREANRAIVVNSVDVKGITVPANSNIEMVIQRDWSQNRLRIESLQIQGDKGIVRAREPENQLAFGSQAPFKYPRQAYHFENSLSFLDAPGEWFLDATGNVFYRPRPGETLATMRAVAPRLETLIRVTGQPNALVKNLELRGLTLTDTTWLPPDQYGKVGFQGPTSFLPATANQPNPVMGLTSAVDVRYVRNFRFVRNRIQNTGANGLTLGAGTQNSAVLGNVIQNIAASGIVLHGPTSQSKQVFSRPDKTSSQVWFEDFKGRAPLVDQNRNNQIANNLITHIGLDYVDNCGIFAAYVADTKIEHNQLSYLPYTGISLGWGWTTADTDQSNNLVRANNIFAAMQLMADGGGVYQLSRSSGTQIVENYIHGMKLSPWAERRVMSAVMLDYGTSGLTVARNVIRNFQSETSRRSQDSVRQMVLNVPREVNQLEANESMAATTANQIMQKAGLEPSYRDLRASS